MVEATRPRWKKKGTFCRDGRANGCGARAQARGRAWSASWGGGACAGEWACVMRVRSTFHVRKRVGGRGARASMACVCWRVGRLVRGGAGEGVVRGRGRELFPSHSSPPMFPGLPPHPHTHSGPAMLPLVTHLETSSKFLAKCLLCLHGKPWPSVTDAISPPPPCLPSVPVISMSITSHHFKSH